MVTKTKGITHTFSHWVNSEGDGDYDRVCKDLSGEKVTFSDREFTRLVEDGNVSQADRLKSLDDYPSPESSF